jgi:hypothetical protein
MGDQLDYSLLNPNQLCHHGVIVQDNPYDNRSLHISSNDDKITVAMHTDGTII